jgi:hypothetical protein
MLADHYLLLPDRALLCTLHIPRLGEVYIVGMAVSLMGLSSYESHRMMSYLKKHHQAKWSELTTVLVFGPGLHNPSRYLFWLFSSDDLDDPTLAQMKVASRQFIYFALTVFISIIPLALILGFGDAR